MIPIFSPAPQYETLKASIDQALIDVAASGQYILGPQVGQFETAFAGRIQSRYGIGVNSGTDALLLALKALDIGPGDEVITTPFSYAATSEAIVRTGARPVFVDINPVTFNIDPDAVAAAITERTRALLPVHLFGLAADMTRLMEIAKRQNLSVIEDCAQSAGAVWDGKPVGSIGQFGCFSFFPTKNLGALGDAGAVTTNDESLANRVRALRVHGATPENRYDHQESGINSRLDTLQAAALLVKLPHLTAWNQERQAIARFYTDAIRHSELDQHLTAPDVPEADGGNRHVFHQYTVRLNTTDAAARDTLQARLRDAGIMAMIYYPIPLHLQKTHANLGYRPGSMPQAELAAKQVLSLPIFPGMTREQQQTVIDALKQTVPQLAASR